MSCLAGSGRFGLGILVEAMNPVRTEIIDQVDDGADAPGQRISPVNKPDLAAQIHDGDDIGDPDHTPYGQHDAHGDEGLACPPAYGGHGMGEGQQAVEQRRCSGLTDAQLYDSGSLVEESDEAGGEHITAHPDELGQQHCCKDAEPSALFGPVVLPGTQILADKGGAGHVEAGDGQEGEAFDLGMGSIGGHGQLAEGIDLGLDDHVGKRDDGILYTGGKPIPNDFPEHVFLKTDLSPFYSENIALFEQMGHAEYHAGGLRDDSGQSSRPDALTEDREEQQVQQDVQQGREDEIVQRTAAVPQSVHDAPADIV